MGSFLNMKTWFLTCRWSQTSDNNTDFHHVDLQGVRRGISEGVEGHHRQAVIDPDGRVVLVKKAGVVACRLVVGTLLDSRQSVCIQNKTFTGHVRANTAGCARTQNRSTQLTEK